MKNNKIVGFLVDESQEQETTDITWIINLLSLILLALILNAVVFCYMCFNIDKYI